MAFMEKDMTVCWPGKPRLQSLLLQLETLSQLKALQGGAGGVVFWGCPVCCVSHPQIKMLKCGLVVRGGGGSEQE